MKQATTFIFQVIVALGFIVCVMGYTAYVANAMVTPATVLQVIQK